MFYSSLIPQPSSLRPGATLTEVLMSMLIFSIGVVSIFSLFPISIVRSIRATQLTSSKLFEENFTQLVRMRPDILTAHVPGVQAAVPTPSLASPGSAWQPHQTYSTGIDFVSPGQRTSGLLPEPFGIYLCAVVDLPAGTFSSTTQYPSNLTSPSWQVPKAFVFANNNPGAQPYLNNLPRTPDDGLPGDSIAIAWLPISGHVANFNARGYVVDPLGFWTVFSDNGGSAGSVPGSVPVQLANQFGMRADKTGTGPQNGLAFGTLNDPNLSVAGWGSSSTTHLPRINGGVGAPLIAGGPGVNSNLAAARQVAAYSDSWTVDYAGAATSITGTSVTLPPNAPISTTLSNNVNMRIVLRTADGRATTRTVTSIGGSPNAPVVSWSAKLPLPASGSTSIKTTDITDVRIESFDARYTWLATVNNRLPGRPRITVAVYFNRKFTPGEEHVYKAVFGNQTLVPASAGGPFPVFNTGQDPAFASTTPAALTQDQVLIAWANANAGANQEPEPTITAGNYLFDAVNVDWYQIVDVTATSSSGNYSYVVVTLDRPATTITPTTGLVGRAMAPRGIVKLFEL